MKDIFSKLGFSQEKHKNALNEERKVYNRLHAINKTKEFDEFVDLMLRTTTGKMIGAFIGDDIKTWEDFLKLKGEITAYLYPIQEVRGAKAMEQHLKEQLDNYYKNPLT